MHRLLSGLASALSTASVHRRARLVTKRDASPRSVVCDDGCESLHAPLLMMSSAGLRRQFEEWQRQLRMLRRARTDRVWRRRSLVVEALEDRTLLSAKIFPAMPAAENGIPPAAGQNPEESTLHVRLAEGMDGMRYLPPQQHVFNTAGFLSEPSGAPPLEIAFDYLSSHATDLGLTAGELEDALVTDQYVSEHTGVTHIYLRQTYGGLEVTGADININVTSAGQVINVGSTFLAGLGITAGFPQPALTAVQALGALGSEFDWELNAAPAVLGFAGGLGQSTLLAGAGISHDAIPASLHYVPTPGGGVELAWNLVVDAVDGDHWFDASVSALNGELVALTDWVHDAGEYNVFALPLESPSDGGRTLEVDPDDPTASPFGWHDTDGVAGSEFTITQGNNVQAYLDRDDDNAPDSGSSPDGGASLIFDFPIDLGQEPDTYQDAAVTNLFYWNNILHDVHYQYGFDEASGNFQENNYGNGGADSDGVLAEAQDGADVGKLNNANFATPPDGFNPRMQMFLWNNTTPMRDGDLDNGIIAHEYGHGISNRLTGGPANASALNANQSRGMGEGWSDWHALMLTQLATDAAGDGRGIGTYALGQPATGAGIRSMRYSYDMAVNSHTYGGIAGLVVPHGVGEVWASTLWDLNWALIEGDSLDPSLPGPGMGFDPDLYNGTGGNNLAMQLVMDGMKLQPANPSFLDARDAILMADQLLTGGANEVTIWSVFARRGMGFSADDGGDANATIVTEAFDLPSTRTGSVAFDAEMYETGDTVTITVRDSDLAGGGPIDVTVVSDRGDSETVTLTQIGSSNNFGVFRGTITTSVSGAAGDGTLTAVTGDLITVTYNDADDGTGNPAEVSDTAEILNLVDVFHADFSDAGGAAALDGFTIDNTGAAVEGLWHLSTGRGNQPGHSSDDSLYFGTGEDADGNGNYNVGQSAGRITSPVINLTGKTAAELTFNYFLQTESSSPFFDAARVLVSENAGPFMLVADKSDVLMNGTAGWTSATVDLTGFVGSAIRVQFEFDTLDSTFNTFEGWYVDDVTVRAAGDRLFAVPIDGTDDIVELDPATGVEMNRFAAPEAVSADVDGLAFDGATLFFINGSGSDTLWELDPETGAVLDSTLITTGTGDFDGLAVLKGSVFILDFGANDIIEFDAASNSVTSTLHLAGGNFSGGLAAITNPDRLVATDSLGDFVLEIDYGAGTVTNVFTPSGPGVGNYAGVAVVGSHLYLGNSAVQNAFDVYSREGEFQSTTVLPYMVSALGGDDRIVGSQIHGRKWNDLDGDSFRDPGEPFLNGWTIQLYDQEGNVIDEQVTADMDLNDDGTIDPETERGWYWFNDLSAGSYTLGEVEQTGWEQTAPGGAVAILYGASTGQAFGRAPSDLYTINPQTGAATKIGPIGFDNVTGLTFLNDGRLVGSANGDDLFVVSTAILIEIDPETGAGTQIGVIDDNIDGNAGRMPDLGYDPVNDVLYGYSDAGTDGLYTIDTTTGAGTLIGETGFTGGGNGLDVQPGTGTLFATPFDNSSLVTIDPSTGAGTEVPGSAGNVPFRIGALDFHPETAVLYGSWNDFGSYSLVTIDTTDGTATTIGPSVVGLDALAWRIIEDTGGLNIGVDAVHGVDADHLLGTGANFELFRKLIDDLGHNIVPLTSFNAPDLAGLDALILNQPYNQAYSGGEINAIQSFVSDGGGLMVHGEGGDPSDTMVGNLNALVLPYGVTYAGTATDETGHTITDFVPHQITSGLSSIGVDLQRALATIAGPALDLTTGAGADDALAAVTGQAGAGNVVLFSDTTLWADPDAGGDRPFTFGDNGRLLRNSLEFIIGSDTHSVSLQPGEIANGFDFGNRQTAFTSIMDDGDAGYLSSGFVRIPDATFPTPEGREGDIENSGKGTGSDTATWTFAGLSAGTYRVSATWSIHENRATNAPYSIFDGAAGPLLKQTLVNQEQEPNDFADDGSMWEDLGFVTITGDTLVVQLSDAANEYVIADAVRIEESPAAPPAGPLYQDDGDAGYSDSGWSPTPKLEGRLNDIRYQPKGTGSETATWTFTGLTPGNYLVSATWSPHPNRATNAPYTIFDGAGGETLEFMRVDQEIAPNDFFDNGSPWETLAVVAISGTDLVVQLSNDANQFVIADAIRIAPTTDEPLAEGTIIDDGDAEFSTTVGWNLTPITEGRGGDVQFAGAGNGSRIATWTFSGLTAGMYRVSATWSPHANRATDAPYTLYDGATAAGTVEVNQRLVPDDFSTLGSDWEDLMTVEITGDTLVVELSNNADGFVIADAVRIQPVT